MNAYDCRKYSRRSVGLTLWLVLLVGSIPISCCAEPVRPAQQVNAAAPLEEFPIAPEDDLLLPVTLAGKDYLFMLDTGSSINMYDTSLRSLLGPPLGQANASGAAGDRGMELFAPPEARLGRLNLKAPSTIVSLSPPQPVASMDLSMLRRVIGEPVFGIIGIDFLQRYIVQLDPDAGKIRFYPETATPTEDWGTPVPMMRLAMPANLACVDARIGQIQTRFLIDTGGSDAGDLDPDLFDELISGGQMSFIAETLTETITGTTRNSMGRAQRFSIGAETQEGLIFARGRMNSLGQDFLTRYRATLDFPHNRLYLRPGKSVARFEYPDMTGLHIIRDEGKTLVHTVDPGSPAQQTQIRAGDEIVEVNHKPAESYKLAVIRRILASAPGDRVGLRTRRDNQNQDCELTLRLFSMPVEKKP
jgi:hypothetical protein